MDIKVKDYVRTIDGDIAKVEDIDEGLIYVDKIVWNKRDLFAKVAILLSDEINKSSPNIIELIEVGDYVNGEEVISVGEKWLDTTNNTLRYDNIKSIVTHQQFEEMEYKVNE